MSRRTLDHQLLHVERSRDSLVLLLGRRDAIAPARVAVVRPSGVVDVAVLRGVLAGGERVIGGGRHAEFRQRIPALAVDPAGDRAFVVPAAGDVAEIDLARLQVSYHALSRRISLLRRVAGWLEPQAYAKSMEGPVRHAEWLGNGLIAVSGGDYSVTRGDRLEFTPAGVRIVDSRNWSVRSIAPGADGFRLAGDLVLGVSETWSSELHQPTPIGVAAYGLDGRARFHLYEGVRAWVIHADARRAYVDPMGPGAVDVVDLASGRVVERRARQSVPAPLVGDGASALG